MDRQHLIEKIQGLRKLSNCQSTTLAEAATAARIAEKLIQEHSLLEAELEVTQGSTEVAAKDPIAMTDWKLRQTTWQSALLVALSKAYNCEGVLDYGADGNFGFFVVGRPSDVSMMRYQYSYFAVELTRLANLLAPNDLGRGSGKTWYKSFYLGAVDAIRKSLKSAKEETLAVATSTALAVLNKHSQEASMVLHSLYPRLRTVHNNHNIQSDAYKLGQQAGSGLNTRPSLNASVKGLLGN